ncbi:myeloblastin-like [Convolutriloba macropyga]|uniref:myeloblastin-like n=1 Tax=Convolutriloba macropyga TaxID=536237 RepID=UPI003F51F9A0
MMSSASSDISSNYPIMMKKVTSFIINGHNSAPRSFYARLLYQREYCGATVISDRFVLTAGHCVNPVKHHPGHLKIEVGDFSQINSPRTQYSIERIYVNPLYNGRGEIPHNDIAVVKTHFEIENGNELGIRLCELEEAAITDDIDKEIIGFCGMGSCATDADRSVLPRILKQMIFKRTVMNKHIRDPRFPELCPEEMICVKPVIEHGNICFMDDGGPLYKFLSRSMVPDCLLGIASFSVARDDTPMDVCNNGSFFTNVPLFKDWIEFLMNGYIH